MNPVLLGLALALTPPASADPPQATGGNWVEGGAKTESSAEAERDRVGGTGIPDEVTNVPSADVPLREASPMPVPPGHGRRCPSMVPVPSCPGRRWDEARCRIVCPGGGGRRPKPPVVCPHDGLGRPAVMPSCVPGFETVWIECGWECRKPRKRRPKPCDGRQRWAFDPAAGRELCTCSTGQWDGSGIAPMPSCALGTISRYDEKMCRWDCLTPERCARPIGPSPGDECGWDPGACSWMCVSIQADR